MTTESDRGDRILTVPNMLSVVRLIGLPVFAWLVLVEHADYWALLVLMLSGFTDWLDGKLARLLDQMSRLGALLDPAVDRLYVVTTLLCLSARDMIPWWVTAVLLARDLVLAPTLAVYRRRGMPPAEVLYLGKAATFLLMFALPLRLWATAAPGVAVLDAVSWAFLGWGTVLYVWTGVLYLAQAVAVARAIPPRRRADDPRPSGTVS